MATSPVRSHPSAVKLSADTWVVVVGGRDPVAAALQFAARLTVPRHLLDGVGNDDPTLDTERDPADLGPQVGLLVVR